MRCYSRHVRCARSGRSGSTHFARDWFRRGTGQQFGQQLRRQKFVSGAVLLRAVFLWILGVLTTGAVVRVGQEVPETVVAVEQRQQHRLVVLLGRRLAAGRFDSQLGERAVYTHMRHGRDRKGRNCNILETMAVFSGPLHCPKIGLLVIF